MLADIKKKLIDNPNRIKEVLEKFGFCHIEIHTTYMNFGRDEKGSKKSIVIKFQNNDYLMVSDYPRNVRCDFFSYIMQEKNVEFIDVLNVIKQVLNITDYYDYFNKTSIFGGLYDGIKKKNSYTIKTHDKSILEKYEKIPNLRFFRDNISLEAQKYFDIRFDIESQGIVIPILDQFGELMGVKIRVNYEIEDGELKYYYLIPCLMSQTLYGYSQNYKYLEGNTVYVYESEKSVLQCYSYGIRNCVALGSSSISRKQIQMLLELRPKKIIFMHDEGLEYEVIERNITFLKTYSRMFDIEIGYWDTTIDIDIPPKASASDLGKEKLLEILKEQIVMIGENFIEEDI